MSLDVRFHPLIHWPGPSTPAHQRKSRWSFRAGWDETLNLLDSELTKLKARDIVIEVGLEPSDIRIDGWPRSNARTPRHPGVIVSFDSRHGPLRYLTDRYEVWQHNLRAIGLGLEALRAVDRYGITQRGEQYVGWKALPAASNGEAPIELLRQVAGIDAREVGDISTQTIYRRALLRAHPDQGGDRETLERVQDAGRKLGVA